MPVSWAEQTKALFLVQIQIEALDRNLVDLLVTIDTASTVPRREVCAGGGVGSTGVGSRGG